MFTADEVWSNAHFLSLDAHFAHSGAYAAEVVLRCFELALTTAEEQMLFDQFDDGPYRIYTGALRKGDGYVAGVAVTRTSALGAPSREVFADESLFNARVFDSAEEALSEAKGVGHDVVRRLSAGTSGAT